MVKDIKGRTPVHVVADSNIPQTDVNCDYFKSPFSTLMESYLHVYE